MDFLKDIKIEKIETINESIYLEEIIDDSIIKYDNHYIMIYKIFDVSFTINSEEGRLDILKKYMSLFNNIDENIGATLIIKNKKNTNDYHIKLKDKDDNLNILREALNDTIDKNINKFGENHIKEKYIAIDIIENDDIEARRRLYLIRDSIKKSFYEINNARIKTLKFDDLIEFYYEFYNPLKDSERKQFKNIYTKDNMLSLKIKEKDLIKPLEMEVHDSYIKFNDTYEKMFYLKSVNKKIDVSSIEYIMSENYEVTMAIKIKRIETLKALKMAKLELGNIEGDIYRMQSKFSSKGINTDLIPRAMKQRREEALYINDSLMRRDENLFDVSIYVMVKGETLEIANKNSYRFLSNAKGSGFLFMEGMEMQEHIFNSIVPYGVNQTPYVLTFDTKSLCGFNIFNSNDVIYDKGDYYGKNILTNNPIIYDLMDGDNFSCLIMGMSGKGKSFKGKEFVLGRNLRDENRETVVIDPNGEWGGTIKRIGGVEIEIRASGENHINLFDIDENYGDNPVAEKEDFILSVCSLILRKNLTAGQRTSISIAVSEIYKKWLETRLVSDIPTIENFVDVLKKISLKKENSSENEFSNIEDLELVKSLMYYSETSHCTLFRGNSEIKLDNKTISFNLQYLGKDLKPLAMEVLLDNIWLRICKNKKLHIPTDIIIDEFHLMFQSEDTKVWMAKYWKMLRKHLGCPIGITQNPEDVLSSEEGRKVVANTNSAIILSMQESDRQHVKDIWKLSEEEIKYIRNRNSGEGIVIFGTGKKIKQQVVLPFSDIYERSNEIYKLINTTYDFD